MSASHPLASDDWTAEEWRQFRDGQAHACTVFSEAWAKTVGRPLVALADRNLSRLEAGA